MPSCVKRLSRGSMRIANIPRSKRCKGFCGAMGICKGNTAPTCTKMQQKRSCAGITKAACSRSIHRDLWRRRSFTLATPTLVTCRAYFPIFSTPKSAENGKQRAFTESPRSWNTVQTTSSFFLMFWKNYTRHAAPVCRPCWSIARKIIQPPGSIPKATAEWSLFPISSLS